MTLLAPGDVGLDFAAARPSPTLMVQRGVKFVCRYLTEQSFKGKACTLAELESYWAVGIATILNGETISGQALGGRAEGLVNGAAFAAAAQKLGAPVGTRIVVSHDTPQTTPAVPLYFQACWQLFSEAGYRIGIYGSKATTQMCLDAGIPVDSLIWAPGALSWGGGRHASAHIWQGSAALDVTGFGVVDANTVKRLCTAWLPGSLDDVAPSAPATPAVPVVPSQPVVYRRPTKGSSMGVYNVTAPGRAAELLLIDGIIVGLGNPADRTAFPNTTRVTVTAGLYDALVNDDHGISNI